MFEDKGVGLKGRGPGQAPERGNPFSRTFRPVVASTDGCARRVAPEQRQEDWAGGAIFQTTSALPISAVGFSFSPVPNRSAAHEVR